MTSPSTKYRRKFLRAKSPVVVFADENSVPDAYVVSQKSLRKGMYLCPRVTVIDGISSTIDMWGQPRLYNYSEANSDADNRGMLSDWSVVADDIKDLMSSIDDGKILKRYNRKKLDLLISTDEAGRIIAEVEDPEGKLTAVRSPTANS